MKKLIFILLAMALMPTLSSANGGDQRVVENKYLINLSRAPFTPKAGVKTSFLASFVDIESNKLISEDIIVSIRIAKLGDAPNGTFLFEQKNVPVKGGVLEFPYTFSEAVLHEIFFDFVFVSNPEKIYNVPDFLLDIQAPSLPEKSDGMWLIVGALLGSMSAFGIGMVVGRTMR